MYIAGIILSILTLVMSALGALAIPAFLTSTDSGGHEGVLYAMGMVVVIAALMSGGIAGILFFILQKQKSHQHKLLVRHPWLPICPPALVALGLNLMLLAK